jgi:hypothetical protein
VCISCPKTNAYSCIGQHYESAKEHLWATVLSFRRSRIRREVEKLRLIFIEHKDVFETILEKLLGLCDYQSEDFDPLIGDEIIALHERVVGFDVEDDSALQTMLARASRLNKLSNFAERLARVIGRRDMSAPLVKVITGLARPQDAFEIFVRFTSGLKNVRKIHILLGLPGNGALTPPIPLRSIKNDSTGQLKIMKPKDEQLKVEPPKVERSNIGRTKIEQSNPRTSREVSTTPTTGLNSGICEEAFNSLPFSERGRGVPYMAPPTRQTLLLLNSLLRKKLPGAHEESYLSFGFASCRNNTESMHLGGLYTALLVDCVDKEESFKAVAQALETDTLVRLFEENGYGADSLRVIPGATAFLRTSSKWRPTVWRLIQFLHAEDVTDPPGYLRRDYGFQWCKGREDVQNLKEIYTRILKKCSSPMELHQACTQSRLWELGLSKQVGITVGDKRLMQNLVGHPDLGFEDGEPPKGYENKHFRKRK